MNTQPLSDDVKQQLLAAFVEVSDWKEIGPFCVDGRDGAVSFSGSESKEHVFVQALGGSLLIAVIKYVKHGGDFDAVLGEVLHTLTDAGYGCGVHRGSHAGESASDCGFADNLQKIITRFVEQQETIARLIDEAAPGVRDASVWEQVIADAHSRSKIALSSGESMVATANSEQGANLQTLDGDHAELAAIVNLAEGTTFNTKAIVESGLQSFNLDLWYVLKQAEVLAIDPAYTMHAALGLYVATEMVLVEDKKQIRLPILINA